ncbi:cyclin-dependent kinase-like 2 isoform X1 [Hemiscyllium ocellatum]|uniref:cyclin-dependent kinase-like 2 isoform X1 n=1 Tax=Hemiscyllium ocellatum TaxID=170820 RepID=UPI00296698AA|nr:cyclin-dependent kinase-like 2 isoform X1 [Hemiscyllium ocellatum]
MEKYEYLGVVGEGSYGIVIRSRNKENGRIVAIKKFLEDNDDKMVKKIAMREIRLLKQLRHENLVNLLEVWNRRKRWYLVFEFVDHTLLDDLEQCPNGLEYDKVRRHLIQILRGIAFCHSHNIIHRDIKPENILVSQSGVVKLCDFGFARSLTAPGETYTDYIATRWYRAPELLVGDTKYGKPVDVWAVGCLVMEMLTGEPLFPGDSEIDQLFHIIRCVGNLIPRHKELFHKNPLFTGLQLPVVKGIELLPSHYPHVPCLVFDLVKKCLQIDPEKRPSCAELLQHNYFMADGFSERFTKELRTHCLKDMIDNRPRYKRSKMTQNHLQELLDDQKRSMTKLLGKQEKHVDPRSREEKSDGKLPKARISHMVLEKADRSERVLSDSCENLVNIGSSQGFSSSKVVSQDPGQEHKSSSDRPQSPARTNIPPITPATSILTCSTLLSSGISLSDQHRFVVHNKMKKQVNSVRKLSQPPAPSLFSLCLSTKHETEKSEPSVNQERSSVIYKKKPEVFKPERVNLHLPEIKAAAGRHCKIGKEGRKISESKIPTLATLDLTQQPGLTSQKHPSSS